MHEVEKTNHPTSSCWPLLWKRNVNRPDAATGCAVVSGGGCGGGIRWGGEAQDICKLAARLPAISQAARTWA